MKRVGIFRSFYIRAVCILATAKLCTMAMVRGFFEKKLNRIWINQKIIDWVSTLTKALQMSPKVINPHNVSLNPKEMPTILMSNHGCLLDIPLIYYAFPNQCIRMLAKKELSRIPVFGHSMRRAEFPFIDRKNRNQALKDLAYAKEIMKTGVSLWMAPEGTRSKDGTLGPLKKGGFITAIEMGAQIIPIGIRRARDVAPNGGFKVWLNVPVEIHIGKPVDVVNYCLDDRQALLNRVSDELKVLTGELVP